MDKNKALEDLSYIKQIIEDSKRKAIDDGIGLIIWGLIVALALFLTYLFIKSKNYSLISPLWFISIGLGWLYTFFEVYKKIKSKKSKSFADTILNSVWFSVGIVMTIIGFVATYAGIVSGYGMSSIMALQVGIGFFITGAIIKSNLLRVAAILWWIGAVSMMFYPGPHVLLQFSIMMLFLQVLPGIILYRKYKEDIV